MRGEDPTGEQVGLAHVVEEAADVAVEAGVDAVQVFRLEGKRRQVRNSEEKEGATAETPAEPHLVVQAEQVGVVLPGLGLGLRDDLPHVPVGEQRGLLLSCSVSQLTPPTLQLQLTRTRRSPVGCPAEHGPPSLFYWS